MKLKLQPQRRVTYFKWAGNFTSLEVDKRAFSDNVREYLQKKFVIGKETERKEDSTQVASDMRKARNTDGTQMFSRAEWLSKVQIQAFSSGISA